MRKANEQPSCVLICGNTGLTDPDFAAAAGHYYKTIVCGKDIPLAEKGRRLPKNVRAYGYDPASEAFERVMAANTPEAVWYLSGYLDDGDGLENETGMIRALIAQCAGQGCAKLIYVSAAADSLTGGIRGFCCAQAEELALKCAREAGLKIVMIRVPRLAREDGRSPFLMQRFEALREGKEAFLPGAEEEKAELLSLENLAELLIYITEETLDESGLYRVDSGFSHTWGEVRAHLEACREGAKVTCLPENSPREEPAPAAEGLLPAGDLRKNYGFLVTDDVIGRLGELYEAYLTGEKEKGGILSRLKKLMAKVPRWALMGAELLLFFGLMQLLLRATGESVYFRYVDIRLFYILIMGSVHGMTGGLLAGLLTCGSLFFSYTDTGVTWMSLFYNVEYWLPFAIYLMTGAITGYVKNVKEQRIKTLEDEMLSLQQKYLFLNEIYQSVIDNKKEYKRQILGYNDSFGKIFEAVQNLDSSMPSDIFMRGVETMERILGNNSIAIYTLDGYQRFGRLVASSGAMSGKQLSKSISISEMQEVYEKLLRGETWRNTELKPGVPAFASGILEEGKVRLIICVWEAEAGQMSLYFMNLFTILCSLIRFSFQRALEYQEAVRHERCVEGTDILKYEYFRQELEVHRRMSETGVASHLLVRFPGSSPEKDNERLRRIVRSTDILGVNAQGECCVLLAQVTGDTFRFVEDRLKTAGIDYEIAGEI